MIYWMPRETALPAGAEYDFDGAAEHIEHQFLRTEYQIKLKFKELHKFLRAEERNRLADLRRERAEKRGRMEEKSEEISNMIDTLRNTVEVVKRELVTDDVSFMKNFKETMARAQVKMEDPEKIPRGALIDVAKHLGNLKFQVWKKMIDVSLVQHTPVILDPNTLCCEIDLSEDLTTVTDKYESEDKPWNPERFKDDGIVVGSEGFDSGTHSWDVEIRRNGRLPRPLSWSVGVLTDSVRKTLGEGTWQEGSWCIGYGMYDERAPKKTKHL